MDVAAYILPRLKGDVESLKLEKLCYLVQAYSLGRIGLPAFREPVEAWEHGPVVRRLYREHRKETFVESINGNATKVESDPELVRIIEEVLVEYGDWTGSQLRRLTHDKPWMEARKGLAPTEGSDRPIPPGAIREYFKQLLAIPAGDDFENGELSL